MVVPIHGWMSVMRLHRFRLGRTENLWSLQKFWNGCSRLNRHSGVFPEILKSVFLVELKFWIHSRNRFLGIQTFCIVSRFQKKFWNEIINAFGHNLIATLHSSRNYGVGVFGWAEILDFPVFSIIGVRGAYQHFGWSRDSGIDVFEHTKQVQLFLISSRNSGSRCSWSNWNSV